METAGQNESGCRYHLLFLLLLIHLLSAPLAAALSIARAAGDLHGLRPARVEAGAASSGGSASRFSECFCLQLCLYRKQPAALTAHTTTDAHTCARRARQQRNKLNLELCIFPQYRVNYRRHTRPLQTRVPPQQRDSLPGTTEASIVSKGSDIGFYLGTFCTETLHNKPFGFRPSK